MDIIYEIRRRYSVQKQTITAIARDVGISRPTVRKHLNIVEEPKYERLQAPSPKLGQFEEQLIRWLEKEVLQTFLWVTSLCKVSSESPRRLEKDDESLAQYIRHIMRDVTLDCSNPFDSMVRLKR